MHNRRHPIAIIDLKFCTLELVGANTEPAILAIEIGTGTLEYTEKRAVEIVKRRGLLETAREGDEQEMDVSFQFVWELLTAPNVDDPPTIEDVLKNQGNASAWLSTNTDPDAPFCIDIRIVYTSPCPSQDGQWETILLPRFQYGELAHSITEGAIDCKGVCLATRAVVTPSTASP